MYKNQMQVVQMAMWRGCCLAVHVTSSHNNASPHSPARLSVPCCTNYSIPEIAFPAVSSLTPNAVYFLQDINYYFYFQFIDDSLNLPLVTKAVTDEFAIISLMATKANVHSYGDCKVSFESNFGTRVCICTLQPRYRDGNTTRQGMTQ